MSYIMGIDTGGTNTDCVLLDSKTKELVASAKAFTTYPDLENGICNALDALGTGGYDDIKFVSLSTTLATNAIVESRGCRTGIILIGAVPEKPLPSDNVVLLKGKIDIKGRERILMSDKEIEDAISIMEKNVDAIAVSGYASVRNPVQELRVMDHIRKRTDIPVFCAHMLSGSLGFWERTTTAALNASLIKIIERFIQKTKTALHLKGIDAPIMIVRSDGTLMNESVAMERPVDTILSGPAASILGSRHLTGTDDALILDMGGTTSDIANMINGKVSINTEGATVGGWLTHCRAAEISTHGIGGDSFIYIGKEKNISVGPRKVKPLCIAGYECPELVGELSDLAPDTDALEKFNIFDCVQTRSDNSIDSLLYDKSSEKDRLIDTLKSGICSVYKLVSVHGFAETVISELVDEGSILHISFTPTDLLHITGEYKEYDCRLPRTALGYFAKQLHCSEDKTIRAIRKSIIKKLTYSCIQSAADFEHIKIDLLKDPVALYLLDKSFSTDSHEFLNTFFRLEKPLIGVGGPAAAWLPEVACKLNCQLIIPQHSDVANAIGAATACFAESAKALIRQTENHKYTAYLPDEKCEFNNYESCIHYAKQALDNYIRNKMKVYGADSSDFQVRIEANEIFTETFSSGKKHYIETRLTASSNADPVII